MNIRLEKEIRVRLSHEEVEKLKTTRELEQSYSFGLEPLNLKIQISEQLPGSQLMRSERGLVIDLGRSDFESLTSNASRQELITIQNVQLEVDKWTTKTRSEVENSRVKTKK